MMMRCSSCFNCVARDDDGSDPRDSNDTCDESRERTPPQIIAVVSDSER